MKKLFVESFIPVILTLTLLFVLLVYANVVSSVEQDQAVIIEIAGCPFFKIYPKHHWLPVESSSNSLFPQISLFRRPQCSLSW